jgi:hypothetical protein
MLAVPAHSPLHVLVGASPGLEMAAPMMMVTEPQILAVLRTGWRVGPHATIAALELYDRQVGVRWCYG